MLRKFFKGSGIPVKDFCVVFILVVNAFTWFYMSQIMINEILEGINITEIQDYRMVIVLSAYFGSIVISSIIGSILAKGINRFYFISAWTMMGIATSVVPILFSSFTWIDCLTFSILLGASFGLGLPSCLSCFADLTRVENRGRISGIMLLLIFLVTPILTRAFSGLDLTLGLIVFAGWRSLGLTIFFLQPKGKPTNSERKLDDSFSGIIKDKTFGFYILAWIMFCLVDRLAGPIVIDSLGKISESIAIISPIFASITALISGVVADYIGRKRVVLYGFISLGIAYAIIGITRNPLAGYFFVIINGITVGLLFVTFIFILWGDISQSGSREKYYALGGLPFFLTYIIGYALDGFLAQIQETSIFSVAAFFLFLAVLPLLYTPETLPQKKMELRRLREFAEDAKKAKEEYERKINA